jgi:hypothetical protein
LREIENMVYKLNVIEVHYMTEQVEHLIERRVGRESERERV